MNLIESFPKCQSLVEVCPAMSGCPAGAALHPPARRGARPASLPAAGPLEVSQQPDLRPPLLALALPHRLPLHLQSRDVQSEVSHRPRHGNGPADYLIAAPCRRSSLLASKLSESSQPPSCPRR